ncbi:hypothetical protein Esti_004981 [Eimeria stiedai]
MVLPSMKPVSVLGDIDDIVVCTGAGDGHRAYMQSLFRAPRANNFQLHQETCSLGGASIFSATSCRSSGVSCAPQRPSVSSTWPYPGRHRLCSGFSVTASTTDSTLTANCSITAPPFFQVESKHKELVWTREANRAWSALCAALSTEAVLAHRHYERPFCFDCGGSRKSSASCSSNRMATLTLSFPAPPALHRQGCASQQQLGLGGFPELTVVHFRADTPSADGTSSPLPAVGHTFIKEARSLDAVGRPFHPPVDFRPAQRTREARHASLAFYVMHGLPFVHIRDSLASAPHFTAELMNRRCASLGIAVIIASRDNAQADSIVRCFTRTPGAVNYYRLPRE